MIECMLMYHLTLFISPLRYKYKFLFLIIQVQIRALALKCLREILRHQPRRFCDYAELTTLRILEAHKDPDWRVCDEFCACDEFYAM